MHLGNRAFMMLHCPDQAESSGAHHTRAALAVPGPSVRGTVGWAFHLGQQGTAGKHAGISNLCWCLAKTWKVGIAHLLKIPLCVSQVLAVVAQKGEDGAGIGSIDFHLTEQGEGDPILAGGKGLDVIIAAWFLAAKLVARKAQHLQRNAGAVGSTGLAWGLSVCTYKQCMAGQT